MSSIFQKWTTIFPGKMGLSWKRGWDGVGTKEEAEAIASKNCNVIAVPLELFERIKDNERRMVIAERFQREVMIKQKQDERHEERDKSVRSMR